MFKVVLALAVVLAVFVAESSCQKFILPTFRPPVRTNRPLLILPTFRPPPRKPVLRLAREAGDPLPTRNEVLVLAPTYELHSARTARSLSTPSAKRGGESQSTPSGTHDTGPTPPGYNQRNARSVDSPSAKRGGGGSRTSNSGRNTGPTHPGYNRRNAREIRLPGHLNPLRPKPLFPPPTFPAPIPRIPILARTARDIQIPGVKKPTHRDVIIPNWNPNARTNPWNRIGGRRHTRSIDFIEGSVVDADFEALPHDREARDIHISGLPDLNKPTHRDVIIPNWNPHARTSPWQRIGGGRHH